MSKVFCTSTSVLKPWQSLPNLLRKLSRSSKYPGNPPAGHIKILLHRPKGRFFNFKKTVRYIVQFLFFIEFFCENALMGKIWSLYAKTFAE